MGSSSSKGKEYQRAAKYGQIYLKTDKSTYSAGETVTGKVYLSLIKPYPGKEVFIKFKGAEAVHIADQGHQLQNGTMYRQHQHPVGIATRLHEEKHVIINKLLPLHSFPAYYIESDQYAIPFSFRIPSDLPSTFHQEGFHYLANVSYRIEAILKPSNMKSDPVLKYKQSLVIRQPVRDAADGLSLNTKKDLECCLCLNQGFTNIDVQFEKNYYCPEETARILVNINNTRSRLSNENIVFTLKQNLRITAKGKPLNNIYTKTTRQIRGVSAGSAVKENRIDIQIPPFQRTEEYQKMKGKDLKKYLLHLKDGVGYLNSTTKSSLITSEYFLEVSCPMDGACTETPVIVCPIEIYHPEALLPVVEVPADWQPQVFEVVNLPFEAGGLVYQNSFAPPQLQAPGNIMTNQVMVVNNTQASQQFMPNTISPSNIMTTQTMMVNNQQQPNQQFMIQNTMPPSNMMTNQMMMPQPSQQYMAMNTVPYGNQLGYNQQPIMVQPQVVYMNAASMQATGMGYQNVMPSQTLPHGVIYQQY